MKQSEAGIIGGGLAGLSLAILLARKGKQVILWDKGSYPAHRVCGEYISRESLPFLRSLLPEFSWDELPGIDQLLISSPSGKTIREKLPLGGFGISRYLLDSQLAMEARKSGAEIQENARIENFKETNDGFSIELNDEQIHCSALYLAYGKGRGPGEPPRNPKKGKHYIGVKYHIRFPHPSDEIQLHNFRNGYCGMSRIENGVSCLCYLVDATELKKCGNDISCMEEQVIQRNPFLYEIFKTAEFLWKDPLVISGIRFGEWGSHLKNALLLGDAAGCIAPLCGNGMSMALHSAKVIGENSEENYRVFRKKELAARIKAGSVIQSFFGNEILTDSGIHLLNILPATLRRQIISKTHGQPF